MMIFSSFVVSLSNHERQPFDTLRANGILYWLLIRA